MRILQTQKLTRTYIPILLFIFCFLFRLAYIEKRDISLDEPFSIFHAQHEIQDIIKLSSSGEPNPPTHLIILHYWIKVFGNSAFAVRVLSILFSALTSVVIYKTGLKFFTFEVGLTSGLLFIFSFYQFFHGIEARTYALLILATSLTLYYFLSVVKRKDKIDIAGLIFSNILLVYTHYFGWFIILVEFFSLLIFYKNPGILKRGGSVLLLTFVSFIPIINPVVKQFNISSKGTWLNPPVIKDYLKEIVMLLNNMVVLKVLLLITLLGLFFYLRQKSKVKILSAESLIVFLWWFLPYTIMFLVSIKIPIFNSRYILFTSIGLYLIISLLISKLFETRKLFEWIAIFIIVVTMALNLRILPYDFGRREIEDTVRYVKATEKNIHNRIIFLYPGWSDLPFMYYYNRSIFNHPYNFESNCVKNDIIRIWNSSDLKAKIKPYVNNDIILIIDRSEEEASVFYDILNNSHLKYKTTSFPETYSLGIFLSKSQL